MSRKHNDIVKFNENHLHDVHPSILPYDLEKIPPNDSLGNKKENKKELYILIVISHIQMLIIL